VQLVGSGDEADVVIGAAEDIQVVELALLPRWLGNAVSVGTALHDTSNAVTETLADFGEHGLAATVFDDIVEECGDGLVFVTTGLEDEGSNGHQVRDVGDPGFLASLGGVLFRSEEKGLVEAGTEFGAERHGRFRLLA
jgi:hypothetical protein